MTAWNPSLLELLDYGDGNAVIQTTSLAPLSKVAPQKPLKFMVGSSFSKADCFCSFPDFMAKVMHFGPLNAQASGFLRLVGMLVSGFGMLYVLSGRLNAEGFVFATLIDRPFVAPTMAALWYFGALPAPLALLFAIEDSASWLWTLMTWRAEHRLS